MIAQYDENYFEPLVWSKYLNYLAAFGLDGSQIERGLKLYKIRKIIMKK